MRILNSKTAAVAAAGALLVVAGAGGATAAGKISGKQIKSHSIGMNKLKQSVINQINAPGPQGPAGPAGTSPVSSPNSGAGASNVTPVTTLGGAFKPRASDAAGLKMTGDGVQFGPFADGGACEESDAGTGYARLDFSGLNGKKLSEVTQLDYTGWYVADTDTGGVGSPTLRITAGGDRYTFSPNTQFNQAANYADSQGEVHTWLVTHGTVRKNDDAGNNPAGEKAFASYVAAAPNAVISNVDILNGCQNGKNLQSVIRSMDVNGTHYQFGSN